MRRRCGLESALRTAAERRNDTVRRRLSLSCRFGDADTNRLQQSAALPDPLAVQYAAAEQQCRGCGVWSRIKLERARRRSRSVAEGSRAASLTCRCQVPSAKWRRTPASQMWSQASSAARPRSSAPCAKPPRPASRRQEGCVDIPSVRSADLTLSNFAQRKASRLLSRWRSHLPPLAALNTQATTRPVTLALLGHTTSIKGIIHDIRKL